MKSLLPSIACSICLFLAVPLKGQEAVGPVTPKPTPAPPATTTPTFQSYEKTLDTLIKAGAADKAARQLPPAELRALLDRASTVREHVAGVRVGPATPKPGQPSPKEATETIKGLQQVIDSLRKYSAS